MRPARKHAVPDRANAARRAFQARKGPPQRPHRYGPHRPNGPKYKPGDPVRETGIYEVLHDRDHRAAHEAVMLADDHFPECDTCADRVRFRLVRTAPYIFHDDDFES